jgi:GT2 family glycosyltransferase
MPYAMYDLDLAQPLSGIELPEDHAGLAVVARWQGRPVGFLMREAEPREQIAPAQLERELAGASGGQLLATLLRQVTGLESASAPALPSLTVAICTHGRPGLLARCLGSLLPVVQGGGHPFPRVEVLVVDNAPPDAATADCVAGYDTVLYSVEPRAGLDFARNHAVREASGEWVAFLDDDVVVDAGWLRGLASALAAHPDAGAVTGLVLPLQLDTDAQILFEQRGGFRRGFQQIRYTGTAIRGKRWYPHGSGNFGAGANMAFRREVLKALGGFDEALDTGAPLPGGGDLDIFYRVVRAGHPLIYEPAYTVFHEHRREYAKLRRQYWSWGSGYMAFVSKSYAADPSQRPHFRRAVRWWFTYQLRQVARSLCGRSTVPVGLNIAELGGAFVGLFGTYGRSVRRSERIRKSAS